MTRIQMATACDQCSAIQEEVVGLRSFLVDWFSTVLQQFEHKFDYHERRINELIDTIGGDTRDNAVGSSAEPTVEAAFSRNGGSPRLGLMNGTSSLPSTNQQSSSSTLCSNPDASYATSASALLHQFQLQSQLRQQRLRKQRQRQQPYHHYPQSLQSQQRQEQRVRQHPHQQARNYGGLLRSPAKTLLNGFRKGRLLRQPRPDARTGRLAATDNISYQTTSNMDTSMVDVDFSTGSTCYKEDSFGGTRSTSRDSHSPARQANHNGGSEDLTHSTNSANQLDFVSGTVHIKNEESIDVAQVLGIGGNAGCGVHDDDDCGHNDADADSGVDANNEADAILDQGEDVNTAREMPDGCGMNESLPADFSDNSEGDIEHVEDGEVPSETQQLANYLRGAAEDEVVKRNRTENIIDIDRRQDEEDFDDDTPGPQDTFRCYDREKPDDSSHSNRGVELPSGHIGSSRTTLVTAASPGIISRAGHVFGASPSNAQPNSLLRRILGSSRPSPSTVGSQLAAGSTFSDLTATFPLKQTGHPLGNSYTLQRQQPNRSSAAEQAAPRLLHLSSPQKSISSAGGGPSRFSCDHCGKAFSGRAKLESHVAGVHGPGPRFPCPICDKLFTYKQHVYRHVRNVHKMETHCMSEFFRSLGLSTAAPTGGFSGADDDGGSAGQYASTSDSGGDSFERYLAVRNGNVSDSLQTKQLSSGSHLAMALSRGGNGSLSGPSVGNDEVARGRSGSASVIAEILYSGSEENSNELPGTSGMASDTPTPPAKPLTLSDILGQPTRPPFVPKLTQHPAQPPVLPAVSANGGSSFLLPQRRSVSISGNSCRSSMDLSSSLPSEQEQTSALGALVNIKRESEGQLEHFNDNEACGTTTVSSTRWMLGSVGTSTKKESLDWRRLEEVDAVETATNRDQHVREPTGFAYKNSRD